MHLSYYSSDGDSVSEDAIHIFGCGDRDLPGLKRGYNSKICSLANEMHTEWGECKCDKHSTLQIPINPESAHVSTY